MKPVAAFLLNIAYDPADAALFVERGYQYQGFSVEACHAMPTSGVIPALKLVPICQTVSA